MHFKSKVARDQENIFHIELCVNKSTIITLLSCETFSSLLLSYYIQQRLKGLIKCILLEAFAILIDILLCNTA